MKAMLFVHVLCFFFVFARRQRARGSGFSRLLGHVCEGRACDALCPDAAAAASRRRPPPELQKCVQKHCPRGPRHSHSYSRTNGRQAAALGGWERTRAPRWEVGKGEIPSPRCGMRTPRHACDCSGLFSCHPSGSISSGKGAPVQQRWQRS